ncbi:MAG TPA: RtcB family protein [Burkholderiaceae bacterium]|nr:RtcB family protein [Burkholderiaceae bacterium]
MDIGRLKRIDDWTWDVPGASSDARAARLYGSRSLLEAMDDKVLEQITNVARLPGLVGAAFAMPDAHWGYGFPIGGVAAFDPEAGGIISAGGVGFDISCGIRCLRTNLTADEIAPKAGKLGDALLRDIPAGVGVEGTIQLDADKLDEVMLGGAHWALEHGYGVTDDLAYIEERGRIRGAKPANVSALAKKRQRGEMGTLGSGNHYLEVQRVAEIFDAPAAAAYGLRANQVLVSIHCGSRGLGHQIGTEFLVSLAKAASRLGIALPDRELACAPILSPEGQEYLGAMNAAINCALANRQILVHLTREVFDRRFPHAQLDTLYDVSHNTCKAERHLVDGRERLLYVHRKGATRAFGPGHPAIPPAYRAVGQPVIIGGSMGTGSYILAGTRESETRAWSSASHGAGRAMSRNQALRRWRGSAVVDELGARGIVIRSHSMRGVAEEAPGAYKDIDEVAEATERAGLAKRVASLRPLVCVKG